MRKAVVDEYYHLILPHLKGDLDFRKRKPRQSVSWLPECYAEWIFTDWNQDGVDWTLRRIRKRYGDRYKVCVEESEVDNVKRYAYCLEDKGDG